MKWRDRAACGDTAPLFDPLDHHDADVWPTITATAQRYCSDCPVVAECGEFADTSRHFGIWAGVYRYRQHGQYTWRLLTDTAQTPQLTDRRTGVNTGWVA